MGMGEWMENQMLYFQMNKYIGLNFGTALKHYYNGLTSKYHFHLFVVKTDVTITTFTAPPIYPNSIFM